MKIIEYTKVIFSEYIEQTAINRLNDEQYHEYQGLFFIDKLRYLINAGINIKPIAAINGYINL